MNKQISKYPNKDIHDRIYNFIIRVLNLIKALPKNQENIIFSEQLTRCVTSMGANDQEADACGTRRDFISKYTIVKKENKETNFWLKIIFERSFEYLNIYLFI